MRPDGAVMPPRADARLALAQVPAEPEFVERVMWYWRRGFDTRAISLELMQHECVVARAVRVGRDLARAA